MSMGEAGGDRRSVSGASLLLVEDDPINADIASRMLEKMGMRVTVAGNGLAALQSWQQEKFDLVLMDCEMAEMDGFEATREIRRRESRDSRTRIVALTAHSAAEVREKCLEAGMDDVLAKPFKDRQVADLVGRWWARTLSPEAQPPRQAGASIDQAALDQASAFKGSEGRGLLKLVAARFTEVAPAQVRALRQKHEDGDLDAIRRTAHTLKSSSAALGAHRVSHICADIERHAADRNACAPFLPALEQELAQALEELMQLVKDHDEQALVHG